MYKDLMKGDVENMLDELYERRHIDENLGSFYTNFYEENKEIIVVCHGIVRFKNEEPEYHIGELEVAYRKLKELFEVDDNFTQLEQFERESMKYRRSTK